MSRKRTPTIDLQEDLTNNGGNAMKMAAQPVHHPRTPRYRRIPNYQAKPVGRPKARILSAVGRFRYLTAEQLARLLYQPSSLSYVRQHLCELYHGEYLQRVLLPSDIPHGSPHAVYCLDNRGHTWLSDRGEASPWRFRAVDQGRREGLFLKHTLASLDVLIAAHVVTRTNPRIQLNQFFTDYELKQQRFTVVINQRKHAIVPDGWLDLSVEGEQGCIALELDRGTEDREAFQQKIRLYVPFITDVCMKALGADSLSVAVITTDGADRLSRLIRWTEAELTQLGEQGLGQLFVFAAVDTDEISANELFFSPLFSCLFGEPNVSLLSSTGQG
jgi:hypothetical protein